MWKDVGLNVKIVLKENFAQVFQPPGRGINNTSDTALYPDPVTELWRRYGKDSTLQVQYKMWSDDEFNSLGPTLVSNLDTKARYTAFQRMLDIYDWEDPPGTVLFAMGMFYASGAALHWQPYPGGTYGFPRRSLQRSTAAAQGVNEIPLLELRDLSVRFHTPEGIVDAVKASISTSAR